MLWFVKRDAVHGEALERVRQWTRTRFALPDEATVLVTEIACGLPGCPPLETVIAFWTGETRHHWKVFKPVAAVVEDDLPPSWMKPALVVSDDAEFDCGC